MKLESGSGFWLAILVSAALHLLAYLAPNRGAPRFEERILQDRWATNSVEVSSEPSSAETSAPPAQPQVPPATPEVSPEHATSAPSLEKDPEAPPVRRIVRESVRPQKPRERAPEAKPSSLAARNASAEAPPSQGSTAAPAGSAGTMGSLELPFGVRHLASAFTRALPASNYTDVAWTELPAGTVGHTELEISVDDEGHLGEVKYDPRFPPAAVIERMVKNAMLLLKSGVFSIDARSVSAGSERLSIEVSLRDEPAPVAEGDSRGLFRKSYEPPSAERAGRASFVLNSGRHMEAVVRMLRKR